MLHFAFLAAAKAAASCGRRSRASAPFPVSNSEYSAVINSDSAGANRSIASLCASIPSPERCCCCVETRRYATARSIQTAHKLQSASLSFLAGIEAKDELEGMLAAQLLASHNAAMECYRRAMISEQSFEGRKENLSQANKLSRTHATLLEALNRHRGKGQQKVTVEHVHVHSGGQAIVGNVEGGGVRTKSENQPHALGYAPGETLWSENAEREAVPVAGD